MNGVPEVSVVMSVYNGAEHLAETLDSVLNQQGCAFEFIVIDDGSTDASAQMLDDYAARDPRLRVMHQQNTGLTRALIRGCDMAKAEFIARQDAGDISLPGRLAAQVACIRAQAQAVMVACAVRFVGPGQEPLHCVVCSTEDLEMGLRQNDLNSLRGPPHHGATLFRKDAYVRAGGYRTQFSVAQDLDLWLRLAECGRCLGIPQVLYRASLAATSISNRRRHEQFSMAELALASRRLRMQGKSDESLLAQSTFAPTAMAAVGSGERARFHYFIACCLRRDDPAAARKYYRRALRENPLHLRALLHWVLG